MPAELTEESFLSWNREALTIALFGLVILSFDPNLRHIGTLLFAISIIIFLIPTFQYMDGSINGCVQRYFRMDMLCVLTLVVLVIFIFLLIAFLSGKIGSSKSSKTL